MSVQDYARDKHNGSAAQDGSEDMSRILKKAIAFSARVYDLAVASACISVFPRYSKAPRHTLPAPLIISVTSYPPRYRSLAKTLKSILDQSVKADRIILWIAFADLESLPAEVKGLERFGLEIMSCEDLRSYKKIVPAVELFPDCFIVTADDDVYYSGNWLATLVDGFDPSNPAIVCRRAHRPTKDAAGHTAPYSDWDCEIEMAPDAPPVSGLFPTGIGGVLYYPRCLPLEALDRAAIQELCPDADDVWLYWMGQMTGLLYKQVGGPFNQTLWPRTQKAALLTNNFMNKGNDRQLYALQKRYGRS